MDVDPVAKAFLEEAQYIFTALAEVPVEQRVHLDDFQGWWKGANENIQSSKSGSHFGHYKATAHEDSLSALHVSKMNLALRGGVPLDRWKNGLTCLLE